MKTAMFGAGCFWGVESLFRSINGVVDTTVGYSGGSTLNPTYKEICMGDTNHAEVILIEYDESIISYLDLLKIFFKNHNPTTLNRQGPDIGTQYRSVIFYYDETQKDEAETYLEELESSNIFQNPIVTQILEHSTFYKAEEYHQQYLKKNGLDNCHL